MEKLGTLFLDASNISLSDPVRYQQPTMTTTRTYHGTLQLVATWLLLGANTVTATILTLSKVETIASVGAPLRCVIAYNTPIVGCNAQELGKDNKCSMQCERALEEVQSNIQRDCQGIAVPRNSLVSQAQQGNLIKVLCDQEPTRQPGSFTRIPDVKTQPAPPPPPPPPATASSEEQTSETTVCNRNAWLWKNHVNQSQSDTAHRIIS